MPTTPQRTYHTAYLAYRALGYTPRAARILAVARGVPVLRPWANVLRPVQHGARMYAAAVSVGCPGGRARWRLCYAAARAETTKAHVTYTWR
jgi:hypothetical protein